MTDKKQIIAFGGGGFTHNEDKDLDQFFLDQISKENCSIGFLPTAVGKNPIEQFSLLI